MEKIQNDITKLIEQYQFILPFSNQTDDIDYPSMRKLLEKMKYLNNIPNSQKEPIHPFTFEIIQNKDNFFVKEGTTKWHKNIVIPQIHIRQSHKQDNHKSQQGQFEIEIKCWAKKENGTYQEISLENNVSPKKLENSHEYGNMKYDAQSDQTVKFSSLKFSSTGYLESEISKSPSGQNNQVIINSF